MDGPGGVDQVRVGPVPRCDRVRAPGAEPLLGEPEHPAGHRDRDPVAGKVKDQRAHCLGLIFLAKYAAALRRISFSCSNSRTRLRALRSSADSDAVTPDGHLHRRQPASTNDADTSPRPEVSSDLRHGRLTPTGQSHHITAELRREAFGIANILSVRTTSSQVRSRQNRGQPHLSWGRVCPCRLAQGVFRAGLVVCDNIALLPVSQDAAEGPYWLVDAAHEKRSVAISSKLHPAPFDVLMPKTLATTTVDRHLRPAQVCQTSGEIARPEFVKVSGAGGC